MATKKLTSIEKRRKLEALFDRGGLVTFNRDEAGRPIINPETPSDDDQAIWVGPPSPLQREMAVREAQAARARIMLDARDNHESHTWLTIQNFVHSMKRDAVVDYILELDETEHIGQARRDVLQQKEWEDFNAFRDAMRQWEEAGSPNDDEWAPLLERDRRFGQQIADRVDEIRDDARAGYMHMPLNILQEKAIEKRVDQAGTAAFMTAYEEWVLYYACRDDEDHLQLFFDSPDDIKRLPEAIHGALAEKLRTFITDASEAKN